MFCTYVNMALDSSDLSKAFFDKNPVGANCLLCLVDKNRKEGKNGAPGCTALM